MNSEALKLTFYFGERDRHRSGFLAEAVIDLFAETGIETSILLRGSEGFGLKHRLRTDRLLSLSEDLPLVAVAVDRPERVESVLPRLAEIAGGGLITLERARRTAAVPPADPERQTSIPEPEEELKLTLYLGRHHQFGDRPAHVEAVEALREAGVAGATVLLGVDGTVRGGRRRARFFAANSEVPTMVIAVGARDPIAAAASALEQRGGPLPATVERIRVCKRDGARLWEPRELPEQSGPGLGLWTKLMVYCSEASEHEGSSLQLELIRRLRAEGAAGATALRGVWGFHGDHAPHGDRVLKLRRRVPAVTVVVDTPSRSRRWFEIADELTRETGLLTSEVVPALRATGSVRAGGLRLAEPLD